MKRFLKSILTVGLIFSFAACADEGSQEDYEPEEIHQDMTEFWQEQRDEFVELTESQLESFEEEVAELREDEENGETIEKVEEKMDEIREDLADLKESGENNWEELRNSIAGTMNDIRSEIEDL
jgi:TolA-binding protein